MSCNFSQLVDSFFESTLLENIPMKSKYHLVSLFMKHDADCNGDLNPAEFRLLMKEV